MANPASLKFLKELPSLGEMQVVMGDLKGHGQQGAAIIGVAYIEHALERLLSRMFVPMNKEDHKRLFDGSAGGILGNMNAKLRVAYVIGIFGDDTYENLKLLNTIRNVFAHSLHKLDFSAPELGKDVARLTAVNIFRNADGSEIVLGDTFDAFVWNVAALHGIVSALADHPGFKLRIDFPHS